MYPFLYFLYLSCHLSCFHPIIYQPSAHPPIQSSTHSHIHSLTFYIYASFRSHPPNFYIHFSIHSSNQYIHTYIHFFFHSHILLSSIQPVTNHVALSSIREMDGGASHNFIHPLPGFTQFIQKVLQPI